MPCVQLKPEPGDTIYDETSQRGFATHEACAETCNDEEGACCDGAECSVTPPCECDGPGKTYMGAGTTCSPDPCNSENYCAPVGRGKCCTTRILTFDCPQSNVHFSYTECLDFDTEAHCNSIGGTWTERACCSSDGGSWDANCGNVKWCNQLP